jgi:RimJ/RimL family protein N-acetyltransferase
MWAEAVPLEGRWVRLEPLEAKHAEGLAAAASPDLFPYHFPPRELTPEGFREQIDGLRQAPMSPWAIVELESGCVAGMTSYLDIQQANRGLEIGFTWIGKKWQGGSTNPECKLLLLSHAFDTLGCVRVQLKTDLRNTQSQGAIAKLGAVREGVLRKHVIRPDGYVRDTVMYSITAEEWPAVRRGLEARLV